MAHIQRFRRYVDIPMPMTGRYLRHPSQLLPLLEGRGGGAGAYYTLASFLHSVICVAISFVNLGMLTKTKYIANIGPINDLE